MTNAEKFNEVFGFVPYERACIAPHVVCEVNAQGCSGCPFDKFWDKEYKACFKFVFSADLAKGE